MTELDKIIHAEYYFPKLFSDIEERDFGILFYNTENVDSNDSNHAIITALCDKREAVSEIKSFYFSKGIIPLIYSSLKEGELNELRSTLYEQGFVVNDYGYNEYLVYNRKTQINEPFTLDIRRFIATDDLDIFACIVDPNAVYRTKAVIKRRLMNEEYFLFIGYADNEPVVMASIQFDENMTARLDEVETSAPHRGKGYARQITRHITECFEQNGGKLFFTWAANDTAQRVYLQGGFEVKYRLPHWSASIEQ